MKASAVTATALGLTRNESSRRFPHVEDPAVLESLRSEVTELLTGGSWEDSWQVYDLDSVTEVETEYFIERGLMTPGFAEGVGEGRGFAVYGDGQVSIEINGVDLPFDLLHISYLKRCSAAVAERAPVVGAAAGQWQKVAMRLAGRAKNIRSSKPHAELLASTIILL